MQQRQKVLMFFGSPMPLGEISPGLFSFKDSFGFKTQYHFEENGKLYGEYYCADSGENFWGDAKDKDDREKLMVQEVSW